MILQTLLYQISQSFLKSINLSVITNDQQLALNADITCRELEEALQCMKLGKTPRLDGLPTEIYRAFKEDLLPQFQELLAYCHQANTVPNS